MENFQIRFAEAGDAPLILEFVKELAEYEKLIDEVVATPDLLREWLFDKKIVEVLMLNSRMNDEWWTMKWFLAIVYTLIYTIFRR
jgi:hypothetical protein